MVKHNSVSQMASDATPCNKRTSKTENFLAEYIDLDSRGSYLAERESVQIGTKRYRFKINGVVTVSPEMLKGEIGDQAREWKRAGKIPNYINKKSRSRKLDGDDIVLCRWLPQRWTPFIKTDPFGVPRVYEDWHMWYGGYYVDPYVASALADWTFRQYTPNVQMGEGVVQGKRIIALENAVAGSQTVTLQNLETAQRFFQLREKSDVTKHIRKETLVTHQASGRQYLLQFEILADKKPRKSPRSLDAVNEAMKDIFGDGSPCATNFDVHRDTEEDANFNCIRNINDGEQTSITAGEEKVRCEFIDFLKELTSSSRTPPADLAKLEIAEDDDEPVTCASVLPRPIGERLEKQLMKAAKEGTPEELNRVMEKIKRKNCNELPNACTEAEVLKIIEKATLTHSPKAKKKETSKSKGKKRVRNPASPSLSPSEMDGIDALVSSPGGVNDLPFAMESVLASAGHAPAGRTPAAYTPGSISERDIGLLDDSALQSLAFAADLASARNDASRAGGAGPSRAGGAGPSRAGGASSSRAGGASSSRVGVTPGRAGGDSDEDFADRVLNNAMFTYRGLRLRNHSSLLPNARASRVR